ncbi:MAG TPA: DUF1501 domain-containing protein [Acetobacteraceae bacterium]|nr:DUF1501 domain-containing protein [Acetobacteraceae bacterium]
MLIKRRHMLAAAGGLAVTPLFSKGLAAEEAGGGDIIVVAILLNGGNDGLNTVVPLPQYSEYYKLRTPAPPPPGLNMAYAESDLALLAFDPNYKTPPLEATQFAFAPSMLAMRDLYTTGMLAVIPGVGLPKAEQNPFSHYNAQMDWLTGQINIGLTPPDGWLGLTVDGMKGGKLGVSASLGGTSQILIGTQQQGLVINPPMDYFGASYGIADNGKQIEKTYQTIAALPAASGTGEADRDVLKSALHDIVTVKEVAKKEKAKTYPLDSWLDYQLRDIGRLITGGTNIRAYFAQLGGFDTHYQQMLYQPTVLSQLSQSLVNFYEYLSAANASHKVVVVTISDFGRRPYANLDFGTDHGGAGVSFVFGEQVNGGVYGAYPSLKKFDDYGNLAINVDFRNVLSDLIQAMGGNPTPILGQTWPKLGFI